MLEWEEHSLYSVPQAALTNQHNAHTVMWDREFCNVLLSSINVRWRCDWNTAMLTRKNPGSFSFRCADIFFPFWKLPILPCTWTHLGLEVHTNISPSYTRNQLLYQFAGSRLPGILYSYTIHKLYFRFFIRIYIYDMICVIKVYNSHIV